jgi:hypothetical protein
MSTSGTVATTVISTDTLVDHALLRVGKVPAVQTPQIVQQCQESLYMLLLSLANRGLNLWAVEKILIGLVQGQKTYVFPPGTLDILNVIYSQPVLTPVTFAVIANGGSATITSTAVVRMGVQFGAAYTGPLTIGCTAGTLTTITSDTYTVGLWYWFDLPVTTTDSYFTVTGTAPNISNLNPVLQLRDIPMTPINRDTWMALPDKDRQSHPCVNWFYEKKLSPQVTLWPVPDNDYDHLTIMRHRQIQDIGTLSQQIEIRAQWLEDITWQLSLRLAFELPGVDPARLEMVKTMADGSLLEAELDENDRMPSSIQPRITPYTR